MDRVHPFPARQVLKPGSQIIIRSPDSQVVFSGSIKGRFLPQYGLTVAHAFKTENEHVFTNPVNGHPLGQCFTVIREVSLPDLDRYTADLCFWKLKNVNTKNSLEVTYDNGYTKGYALKIFKGPIGFREVMIVDRNGRSKLGKIEDEFFNRNGVFSMLAITDAAGQTSITGPGDSGSLVAFRSSDDDEELQVIGIVTGIFHDQLNLKSKTLANRLGDVLKAIGRNDDYRQIIYQDQPHPSEVGQFVDTDVDFVYP